jgi:hypothetical protein
VTITEPTAVTYTLADNANNTATYKKAGDTLIFTATVNGGTRRVESASLISSGTTRYEYSWTAKPTGVVDPVFVSETISAGTTTATFILTSAGEGHNGEYTISVTDANSCNSVAGSASTTAIVYPTDNLYVNNATGSDATGSGWSSTPLGSITKALDIATAGNTINVMSSGTAYAETGTGGATNGPIMNKVATIKHVNATSPYATLSTEVSFASGLHFVLAVGAATTDSITFSGFTPSAVYVNTSGDIQNAINAVTSTGTVKLLAGTYSITTTQLNVVNGITIQGPTVANDGTASCDMVPTASITVTGTTTMFKTYGSNAKTIKNLILTVGKHASTSDRGRFFEIASGSAGNVNTSYIQFKYDNNTTVKRLYGVTNIDYSAGDMNDVAKFVNDVNDAGYGTGRVVYGYQGPLPWNDLEIGWKAEDGETATEGVRVQRWSPMKSTTKINNPGTAASRPLFYNSAGTGATNGINTRAALKFDGTDEYLHAGVTSAMHGGAARTYFIVFQTGSDLASATNMVMYKHGDENNGVSAVILGDAGGNDDFELNIHSDKTGGATQRASLDVADLAANTTYIAQVYFNGGSGANNRVGLALHTNAGGASDATSNVNEASFDVTTLTTPTTGGVANLSVGAKSGYTYYNGATNTTAGIGNFFNGKVAEILILNTASIEARDNVFCYLRNKYFADVAPDNDLTKGQAGDDVVAGDNTFQPGLDVFPNPAEDEVNTHVAIRTGGRVLVTLRDALGREIMSMYDGTLGSNTILPLTTDVRYLPSGAYMIHVVGPDDLNLATPFMIRH